MMFLAVVYASFILSCFSYPILIFYLSGNARPQSSQLAEPLWTDPDLKSEVDVHKLIST